MIKSRISVRPSHVALLVRSVDKTAGLLRGFGFQVGKAEEWDGEGTKEIYVEKEHSNSLLLMEPIKPGAYQRAMEKRGPSLHHLAIDVPRLEEFLGTLAGSGWLLHPTSIETIPRVRTAYLSRPGFPALIEVQEKKEWEESASFVTRLELPFDKELSRLLAAIGLEEIVFSTAENPAITLGEQKIPLSALIEPTELTAARKIIERTSSHASLSLELSVDIFSVSKLDPSAPIPEWARQSTFFSISRTPEELSIVCRQSDVPSELKSESNWRALKVEGPLDFGLTGILASIVQPLAVAGVSIFAISTFDTDYILVKQATLDKTINALEQAGHSINTRTK